MLDFACTEPTEPRSEIEIRRKCKIIWQIWHDSTKNRILYKWGWYINLFLKTSYISPSMPSILYSKKILKFETRAFLCFDLNYFKIQRNRFSDVLASGIFKIDSFSNLWHLEKFSRFFIDFRSHFLYKASVIYEDQSFFDIIILWDSQ